MGGCFRRHQIRLSGLHAGVIMLKSFFTPKSHRRWHYFLNSKTKAWLQTWMCRFKVHFVCPHQGRVGSSEPLYVCILELDPTDILLTLFSLSALSCFIRPSGTVCTWENESHYNIFKAPDCVGLRSSTFSEAWTHGQTMCLLQVTLGWTRCRALRQMYGSEQSINA